MEPVKISSQGSESPHLAKVKNQVSLPLDVKKIIFSGLDDEDFMNTIRVSPSFKAITLEISKNEFKLVESFVNWILSKLKDSYEKSELIESMKGTKIFDDSISLAEIKSSTASIIKKILTVMKSFDTEDLKNLESLARQEKTHPHFRKFLKLVSIEKEIERANILFEKNDLLSHTEYQNILRKICGELVELEQFDSAFEIAHKICTNRAIENVIRSLISNNNINKASELIYRTIKTFPTIAENFNKKSFMLEMIKIFKNNQQIDKSFEMLELLLQTMYVSKPSSKKQFDIIINRAPLSDLLKTGLEIIQKEPNFISKYPAFTNVVKSILIIDPHHKIKDSIPETALDAIIIKEKETSNRDKPIRTNL